MKCFQIHVVVVQKVWFVGDLVHSSIMLIKIRTCSAPSFLSSSLILNIKCCPNFHDIFYHYNICSFIKSILGNHFLKQWNYLVNCMDLWYYIYPSQPIIFLFISLDILSISSLFWHLNDIYTYLLTVLLYRGSIIFFLIIPISVVIMKIII